MERPGVGLSISALCALVDAGRLHCVLMPFPSLFARLVRAREGRDREMKGRERKMFNVGAGFVGVLGTGRDDQALTVSWLDLSWDGGGRRVRVAANGVCCCR